MNTMRRRSNPARGLLSSHAVALLAAALLCPRPLHAAPVSLAGRWAGVLGPSLHLVLHFEPADGGGLKGTLDSPDQGAMGIPLGAIVERGDSLYVEVPSISGLFAARRVAADSLAGEWRQSGARIALALSRGAQVSANRPQEPQGALPYDTFDVTVDTGQDGVRLAGTLSVPRGAGPFPAAFLVSGSGPQDRDEQVFGHKPFLVLADHLTRHGIAVLRVDDRGIGRSTGDFAGATSDDFARDAEAAVRWLRQRKEVDPNRVGLVGHSEGGLIAPIVAGRDPKLAFIVLLAGPAVDGEAVMLDQLHDLRRMAGADSAVVQRLGEQQRAIFGAVKQARDTTGLALRLHPLVRELVARMPAGERGQIGEVEAYVDTRIAQLMTPWFRFFLGYDPRPALGAVHCPVLALFGGSDLQVSAVRNQAPMEAALKAANNRDATVRTLPAHNHMFQRSANGSPAEYARIEETMDPAVLDLVSGWVDKRFAAPGASAGL